jgi:NADH:ubiquinone oxidoreductase subunit 2 (subunit N)
MPLPTTPTILLAAGGLAMVAGRFVPARFGFVWGWLFLVTLLSAAFAQIWIPVSTEAIVVDFERHRVWIHDALAISEQWLVLTFGLCMGILLFDLPLRQERSWSRYAYLLFLVGGLMLVAQSNDLLSLGLSLEIVGLSTGGLRSQLGFSKHDTHSEFSRCDVESPLGDGSLPLEWVASSLMWFGIALLASLVVSTQFDAIRLVLADASYRGDAQSTNAAPSLLILLSAGMIMISLIGRMGAVPFHLAFSGCFGNEATFAWGSTVLAGQLAGSIALCRLCGRVFAGLGSSLAVLLTVISLSTFFVSVLMSVRGFSREVRSIPRWLFSLFQLQSGWFCIGLIVASLELEHPEARWGGFPQQVEALGFLVIAQVASFLSLVGLIAVVTHRASGTRPVEFVEDLKGMSQFAPIEAVALLVTLASLIGCPWTIGFWGRWLTMLAGNNLHLKSSSIFVPLAGIRVVILVGIIATLFASHVLIRIFREMFLESPLSRPVAIGGRGSRFVGLIAALSCALLGIAPQLLLAPLKRMESPPQYRPDRPTHGSGKNHSAFRSESDDSVNLLRSLCQARSSRQVQDHFLISTKLDGSTWQVPRCSAQFCPEWSGTSSSDQRYREDYPFILAEPLERPKSEQTDFPARNSKLTFEFRSDEFIRLPC